MRSQDKRYFKDDVGSVVKENDPITINMGYPPCDADDARHPAVQQNVALAAGGMRRMSVQ